MNSSATRKINKWQIFWILFVINLIGFASARLYFHVQQENSKANTEAVDFKNKYGASVHEANTLFTWGVELLRMLRDRN